MQTISSSLKAALIDIDARSTPRVLLDCVELYSSDYIPGLIGFDPADAVETFAPQTLTWNGVAYRREMISRGDIVRSMGEKTNSVTITFSNISRYLATFAQTETIEGMFLVIRTIVPSVTDDSLVIFVGRCDKPSDIDKKQFSLSARQDFGNINQTLPPRRFTADDPEGRLPGDDLFEGIIFSAVPGSYNYPFVRQSNSILGRLTGRRTTDSRSKPFSSLDGTPYGSAVPEILGRCQMELIPFISVDKGIFITALWAASNGPIAGIVDIKTREPGFTDPINSFGNPPAPAIVHLGDAGGTGTNQGNTGQADLGGGSKFSHLAYVEGAIAPTEYFQNPSLSDPDVMNELPLVTALILGRRVALPDADDEYVEEGWSDNPVHLSRFALTDPYWVNIDPAFMEDAVNVVTAQHCDEPLLDDSESQLIIIGAPDLPQAGSSFTRYRSGGLITPRSILYNDFGDTSIIPELVDGPYIGHDPTDPPEFACPLGQHRDPETGECVANGPTSFNATQPLLRKRYTANLPITDEVRAVDFLYKTLFPAAKLFMRVNKYGRYEIRSEKPSDATRLRSATAVGATSIPVLDVTPWKSGDLLMGRIVISGGQVHSETRTVSSADYSTSGNSITLTASGSGGVTATASGATLSGGSTTVQASGTVTIGGTASGTAIITIDGVAISYILGADDTTGTAAAMLTAYINATRRLRQYIHAEWDAATPTVITIKCLHGALNVDSPLLKVHGGPIANPITAPTLAAAGSGSLLAGDYAVAYADVNANGLTALTLLAVVSLTANQKINVSSLPAFPAGVTSRQFFVSEKAGSARLRYQVTRSDATDFSINALPLPNAALPPAQNTTAEELIRVAMSFATNSQDVFPARRPSSTVILNDIYLPDPLNGHKYQATAITTGITGSGTPTWPTTAGGTVVDGGVTWTEIGSTVLQQAGLTRANVVKDTFKWPLGGQQSSVNVIEIPFRDAKNDFALTTLRIHDAAHQAQVKKKYPLKIDGSAIDSFHQAYRIGSGELSKNREGDWFDELETGPQGLPLEEGDLYCSSDDSGGLVNVVTRIEEIRIKANHNVAVRGRKYSTRMFSDDVGSHVIPIASTLRHVQTLDSLAEFIDTPAIREDDRGRSGFYVSVSRDLSVDGDWRGYGVYADYGDGYVKVAQGNVAATVGEATSTLNDVADPTVFDTTNELTVTFKYATAGLAFQNQTEAELLANPYRNLFLVDDEYVQAGTIVDNGNRSFTISDLLHGRFETECVDHAIGARVVYIDGAEVFVPTDPSRIGTEYNYKFVTTNQNVSDATVVAFTWLGNILDPAKVTDLVAVRDESKNWHGGATGHPTLAEYPATYTMRMRRASDAILLRDIPIAVGTGLAGVFEHMPSDPDSENVLIEDNNLTIIDVTPDDFSYGVIKSIQMLQIGSVITATIRVPYGLFAGSPTATYRGIVLIQANDPQSPTAGVDTGWQVQFAPKPSTVDLNNTRVSYLNWTGGTYNEGELQTGFEDIPSINSVVYLRMVFVGTEVRVQVSGSPIIPTAPPTFILKNPESIPPPGNLYIQLHPNYGNADYPTKVENVVIAGMTYPQTIYALAQQEQDLLTAGEDAPTAALGIDEGDLDVEMWQNSPIAGIQGRSVRKVF